MIGHGAYFCYLTRALIICYKSCQISLAAARKGDRFKSVYLDVSNFPHYGH